MLSILIVDDDCNIRTGLTQIISDHIRWPYNISEAESGESALELIRHHAADIIIADIKMPDMNGIEMLTLLKNGGFSGEVIMLSGYDDYSLIRNALKLGAFDYLLKPVNISMFIKILNEVQKKLENRQPSMAIHLTEATSRKNFDDVQINFFDICPSGSAGCIEPNNYLEQALQNTILLRAEDACKSFEAYFSNLSPDQLTAEEIRASLTQWIYSLMQKNNGFIKIISVNRLSDYDIINCIKNLPTLSQLKLRVIELIRLYINQLLHDSRQKDEYMIHKAKQYIELNYSRNITLSTVSENLYIHPNYFSTVFKTKTGVTFREYLRNLRIEKSKQLLADNRKKIYDIALEVGYQDTSHFIRAFKEVTGLTPSQFKTFNME